jgi:hypothetical protein
MNINDAFAQPANTDTPPLPPTPGSKAVLVSSLFGGGNDQKQTQSPLGQSKAALPKAEEKEALASPAIAKPNPPSPGDVQRNVNDLGGGKRDIMAKVNSDFQKELPTAEKMSMGFAMGDVAGPLKGIKAAISAVTNRSAGVSSLQAVTSVAGDTIGKLSDSLYTLGKTNTGLRMQWLTDVKNFLPKDWAEHAENIYHSFEDPSVKLSPRAQELKEKAVEPIMAKNKVMLQKLRVLGVQVGPDVEKYISRVPVGKSSLVDTIQSVVPQGKPRGISTYAPEAQARKVFGMVDDSGTETGHIVQSKNNNSFQVYQGGKITGSGKLSAKDLEDKSVTFMGNKYSLTDSTTKAIEANTPLRYHHDPLVSAIQGNINLSEALHNASFLEQLKHSPEFNSVVVAPSKEAPGGYREVNIPQLHGYKFDAKVANVLDDFSGPAHTGGFAVLNNVARATVGSLFWNPLPHVMNVLDHKLIEGGLVGNLKALTVDLPSTMKTAIAAHNDVMTMSPLYREAIKSGAGLMYPALATRNFAENMAKELGTAPEMTGVAKAWGYANPAAMVKAIYAHSAKSLWSWNDVIMMHAYRTHMDAGQSLPEAIKEVEKHIPNYRLPSEIAGSRALSQIMQTVPTFARYDYGRLASYGNMVKDLIGRDSSIADRAHALDQMAMLAVSSAVIYPAMDAAIRKVTGNNDASIRRFGADSVPQAIYKFSTGQSGYSQLMGSTLSLSPALRIPTEIMTGKDTFTGEKLNTGKAIGRYIGEVIPPAGLAEQVVSGRKGLGEVAAAQVGINLPSQKEVLARNKAIARDNKRKKDTQ